MSDLQRLLRARDTPTNTPHTPLAINNSFDFVVENKFELKPFLERRKSPFANQLLPSPFRQSPHYLAVSPVYSTTTTHTTPLASKRFLEVPQMKPSVAATSNLARRRGCKQLRLNLLQQQYRKPYALSALPKPLSPRVGQLLERVGMVQYADRFQQEEVDFEVFCTLSLKDLKQLGVRDASDRREIHKAVLLAYDLVQS